MLPGSSSFGSEALNVKPQALNPKQPHPGPPHNLFSVSWGPKGLNGFRVSFWMF